MSEDHISPPDPSAPTGRRLTAKELLEAIQNLIAECVDTDRELFRGLCELYKRSGLSAREFEEKLKETELLESRISEIKAITTQAEICAKFIAKKLTWNQALQAARDAAPSALERLGSLLTSLLVLNEDDWPNNAVHGTWKWERIDPGHHRFTKARVGSLVIRNRPNHGG